MNELLVCVSGYMLGFIVLRVHGTSCTGVHGLTEPIPSNMNSGSNGKLCNRRYVTREPGDGELGFIQETT